MSLEPAAAAPASSAMASAVVEISARASCVDQ
jgi:hypothetical protein